MWSDRETIFDCLGFTANVDVLARICTSPTLAPLTLGIFGCWGSGKTSLMKMLMSRIEATNDSESLKTLWFNAWRYEARDEAQSALIHAILGKLEEGQTLGDEAKKLFKKIKEGASVLKLAKFITKSVLTLTPQIDEFLDCFDSESAKVADTMEHFETDFARLMETVNVNHLVVFIDDLDRCSSQKVIETFETIKLFLNIPQCTFVIGADKDKIEHAVGDVYKVGDAIRIPFARDYLEKIIQIPFRIPEQNLRDIECYIAMLIIQRDIVDEGWQHVIRDRPGIYTNGGDVCSAIKIWITDHPQFFGDAAAQSIKTLEEIMPFTITLARGLRGNPRQIKRFLNILALRHELAVANHLHFDSGVLVKLTVLEYTWPDFFSQIAGTVDPHTGQSELLQSLLHHIGGADTESAETSETLANALQTPGLADFLSAPPALGPDLDLLPYLFLAQTSLTSTPSGSLTPLDETARSITARITSPDRIASRAAARQAAAQDAALASAVVKLLLTELLAKTDDGVRTHILEGLRQICAKHTMHYQEVMRTLQRLEAGGSDAIAIAAITFLEEAGRAGNEIPADLRERLAGKSRLASALAVVPKRTGAGGW